MGAGVPCGPINKVSEVVTNPQVLARNMIAEMKHPNVPDLKTPGSPLKLTNSPARYPSPATPAGPAQRRGTRRTGGLRRSRLPTCESGES